MYCDPPTHPQARNPMDMYDYHCVHGASIAESTPKAIGSLNLAWCLHEVGPAQPKKKRDIDAARKRETCPSILPQLLLESSADLGLVFILQYIPYLKCYANALSACWKTYPPQDG